MKIWISIRMALKRIKVQIAVYYILATTGIMLIFGGVLYYRISNVIIDEALQDVRESVDKSGKYVEMYIDRLTFLSTIFLENKEVIHYLEDGSNNRDGIIELIHTTIKSDSNIKSIILVSKDGRVISNEKDLDMTMSEDMMEEEWYKEAIKQEGFPALTSARMQDFSMNKDDWVISITRGLKNEQGDNVGVLSIDVSYNVIEEYLVDLNLGDSGYAYILNSSGNVVFHDDTSYFEDDKKKDELVAICEFDTGYEKNFNQLVHKYQLRNSDWVLIGVASLEQLTVLKSQLMNTLLIVGLILLVVLIIGSSFLANKIITPIQKLENTMKDLQDGLKEIEVDRNGCFEVVSLSNHFNQMVQRIHILMNEIGDNEKEIREYELKVLHSQINPHFLYNTLDTIVWMAEFNDSEKVIAITKALANFFRLSLNGGNEYTTIENEISHATEYLFIQKERYGDELNYQVSEFEAVKDIKIPKIILQPIIENAIYHGIRGQGIKGLIKIDISQNKDAIVFIIEDNGQGFDSEQIDLLAKERSVKLGGVGIKNVDKRLKLYYGEKYGVKIESKVGQGTKVRIVIGLDKENKNNYNGYMPKTKGE